MPGCVQVLAAALEGEVDSFNSKMKAKEEATALVQQGLLADLESARDDCDELQRQLRLAERQLARLRRPKVQLYSNQNYMLPETRAYRV